MSEWENILARILEILHPVLLTALAGPMFYAFFELRGDAWMLPMYLAGFCLLPLSAVVRAAGAKLRSLWLYLLTAAAALWAVNALCRGLMGILFMPLTGVPGFAESEAAGFRPAAIPEGLLGAEIVLGGIWITFSALRLRLRENRRSRARRENDTSWTDRPLLAEKPAPFCLIWFAAAYMAGLCNACPPLCDIALGAGTAYLVLVSVYRLLEVGRRYEDETARLENVPRSKIRRLRGGLLVLLVAGILAAAVPAFLTGGARHYHDLRKWEWDVIPLTPEAGEQSENEQSPEALAELLGENGEYWEPPAWLITLGKWISTAVMIALTAAILRGIWRAVMGTAREFSELPEENGDIAQSLDREEPESEEAGRLRRWLRGQPLTEREKIRREYRRVIRRYRKERPRAGETPAEIEEGAVFPDGFDGKALHERYEKARYGR